MMELCTFVGIKRICGVWNSGGVREHHGALVFGERDVQVLLVTFPSFIMGRVVFSQCQSW
jgi:hypothetical protein